MNCIHFARMYKAQQQYPENGGPWICLTCGHQGDGGNPALTYDQVVAHFHREIAAPVASQSGGDLA